MGSACQLSCGVSRAREPDLVPPGLSGLPLRMDGVCDRLYPRQGRFLICRAWCLLAAAGVKFAEKRVLLPKQWRTLTVGG